jgi:hypothetical protein
VAGWRGYMVSLRESEERVKRRRGGLEWLNGKRTS